MELECPKMGELEIDSDCGEKSLAAESGDFPNYI
jgi:hypothetical protein